MSSIIRYATRPIWWPALAIWLLAFSAVFGNLMQWYARTDLQQEAKSLRIQASANSDEADCRSDIAGYVSAVVIDQQTALGLGLNDRLGPNDDAAFAEAKADFETATNALIAARPYRANAVEICADNPHFSTDDIPREP